MRIPIVLEIRSTIRIEMTGRLYVILRRLLARRVGTLQVICSNPPLAL